MTSPQGKKPAGCGCGGDDIPPSEDEPFTVIGHPLYGLAIPKQVEQMLEDESSVTDFSAALDLPENRPMHACCYRKFLADQQKKQEAAADEQRRQEKKRAKAKAKRARAKAKANKEAAGEAAAEGQAAAASSTPAQDERKEEEHGSESSADE